MRAKTIVPCLLLAAFLAPGCGSAGKTEKTFENSAFVMDTVLTERIYTDGEDVTGEIAQLLLREEKEVLSWTEAGSEISRINRAAAEPAGTPSRPGMEISPELGELLRQILALSEASGGALDPTLGEVIRLWDIGGENQNIPSEEELAGLLQKTGYQKVRLASPGDREYRVSLPEGTTLDLGAVGKGIGCDLAAAFLEEHSEISGALINFGSSSILTFGEKPDGSAWKVAIRDPSSEDPGEYLGVVSLKGKQFLSTSGDYERFFIEDGVKYHHILDPETGFPARSGLASVTVVADSGLLSDGLSTACFVLGYEKGLQLLEQYHAEGIFVDQEGNVFQTPGIDFRQE